MSDEVFVEAIADIANGEPRGLPRPVISPCGFGGFTVEDERPCAYQVFSKGSASLGERGLRDTRESGSSAIGLSGDPTRTLHPHVRIGPALSNLPTSVLAGHALARSGSAG